MYLLTEPECNKKSLYTYHIKDYTQLSLTLPTGVVKAALRWGGRRPGEHREPAGRGGEQGGLPPSRASSPGCLLQTGEGKSKGGFSHGQLIFITCKFGYTGNSILFSLQVTCLAVQWAIAICCCCGLFTHGPEMSYLHVVCLFWYCLSGSSQNFFFQKMQEICSNLSWGKLLLCCQ